MRTWKEILRSLTKEPTGFRAADGRALGLGLATAQENARQQATAEVEDFLRERAAERSTTSS
ncbi:hypothetical protein [Prauserella muralis]|uniref:Uncharacterized protein n=1 Tax=Prauserella muralis TaxID=588067 RepID=A0A2V4AI10_9PSEU|nr:hypothetical protein [Prauserella muralis]PXY19582.1 hypothetical protein BAY60_33200 [Prauserella muralis]TWE29579.1 hypothetical protein FHX69_2264 [Prauserella muralis]